MEIVNQEDEDIIDYLFSYHHIPKDKLRKNIQSFINIVNIHAGLQIQIEK
jgi:hypothetical protein